MKRTIEACKYSITAPIPDLDDKFADDPQATWLVKQAQAHKLTTLLAHADDGVIWGKVINDQLVFSDKVFGNDFRQVLAVWRSVTLQQVRLFGEQAELLLWRDGEQVWRGRLLQDNAEGQSGWRFDEAQLQWGDHAGALAEGFTLVAEGQEGLRHAVPLPVDEIPFDPPQRQRDRWHPLRLVVRHYLDRNEDGTLAIVHSRLTKLEAEPEKKGGPNG